MFFTLQERQEIRTHARKRKVSIYAIAQMRKSLAKQKIVAREAIHPSRVCEYTPEMHAIEMVGLMNRVHTQKPTHSKPQ